MDKKQFLQAVSVQKLDLEKVSVIQGIYGFIPTEEIEKIISICEDPVFIDDKCRLLAYTEIQNAKEDLHVDFAAQKLLPLFDCFDNDFIVWHSDTQEWSLFNIIDRISFKYCSSLQELL